MYSLICSFANSVADLLICAFANSGKISSKRSVLIKIRWFIIKSKKLSKKFLENIDKRSTFYWKNIERISRSCINFLQLILKDNNLFFILFSCILFFIENF